MVTISPNGELDKEMFRKTIALIPFLGLALLYIGSIYELIRGYSMPFDCSMGLCLCILSAGIALLNFEWGIFAIMNLMMLGAVGIINASPSTFVFSFGFNNSNVITLQPLFLFLLSGHVILNYRILHRQVVYLFRWAFNR